MASVKIMVPGLPAPGGSKRAFAHRKTGKIIVTDDSGKRGRDWRSCVADHAVVAMAGRDPLTGPLKVTFAFNLPRPRGHYGTGRNAGNVKASAPSWPTTKPDATKLVRSAEDACTGIVWRDDAQIVKQVVYKVFGNPCLAMLIEELEG